MTKQSVPVRAGDAFVAKFKREPASASDCAWLNGYAEALTILEGEPPAPLPEQLFTAANGRLYRVWGDVSDCSSEAEDEPRMVIYSYAEDTEPKFARESSNFRMFFKPVASSENRTEK